MRLPFLYRHFFFLITFIISLIGIESTEAQDSNFYQILQEYEQQPAERAESEDGNWKRFKRWAMFWLPRVYPTGDPIPPDRLWEEWQQTRSPQTRSKKSSSAGQWQLMGPKDIVSGGASGRVNSIRYNPKDTTILWVGTPDGGLWKSTDEGNTWTNKTDHLPNLGVTDIAINPIDTSIMYIATGDGYGYSAGGEFWGGTYSNGVMKSTDGGETWDTTGLTWDLTQAREINRILIHPNDPDTLLAATNNGIWRTHDGGDNWTQTRAGHFRDLEFYPGNPSTIYATDTVVLQSTDGGTNWTVIKNNMAAGTEAVAIATTPVNSSYIYAWSLTDGDNSPIYKSTDGGSSWSQMTGPGISDYGWYTPGFEVSPVDENTLVAGGVGLVISTDGASNWTNVGGSIHVDHRAIVFSPTSPASFFSGNDGGIYKTEDGGASWTNLSSGLAIMQLYRIGGAATDSTLLFAGAQDNGTNRYNSGNWDHVMGGDGMETIVDYTDPSIVYASYQYGYVYKSTDGGTNFSTNITPSSGDWTTPYVIHPSNPQTLYYGNDGGDIYKTTDRGSSWDSTYLGVDEYVHAMAVAPSNGDVVYASTGSVTYGGTVQLFKSTDGAQTWTNISTGLPVSQAYITYIDVDEQHPDTLWVTFSGYADGEKVYESTDGGNNWTNISGSLPNISINCVEHEKNPEDGLYIGTDFGVYYTNDTLGGWRSFNQNLPNVIVNELELHDSTQKLRAGTYGRSVWESPRYGNECQAIQKSAPTVTVSDTTICSGDSVTFNAMATECPLSWQWTFPGGNPSQSNTSTETVTYMNDSTYDVTLTVTNPVGDSTLTLTDHITVHPRPPKPQITQQGDTLFSTLQDPSYNYQWLKNSFPISGTHLHYHTPKDNIASYTVRITNQKGCTKTSDPYLYSGNTSPETLPVIRVVPNPAHTSVTLTTRFQEPARMTVKLYNPQGKLLHRQQHDEEGSTYRETLSLEGYSAGLYLLKVQTPKGQWTRKISVLN